MIAITTSNSIKVKALAGGFVRAMVLLVVAILGTELRDMSPKFLGSQGHG